MFYIKDKMEYRFHQNFLIECQHCKYKVNVAYKATDI